MADLLLSTNEVAALLRVHRQTLKKWRASGEGPPWFRKGHRYAYRKSGVERWLAEQGDAPPLPEIPPAPPPPGARTKEESDHEEP